MTILVCGSMAYDTIMVFQDPFRKHILPDQIHILNVCFVVPTMRREFGGCAGNIAYNLKLLGDDPAIMSTVGHDFGPYAARLEGLGLSARHIRVLDDQFTAQAFITTDTEDNQITAFHPGAMGSSHLNKIADASGVRLGIVSPDGRDGMLEHARGRVADFLAVFGRVPLFYYLLHIPLIHALACGVSLIREGQVNPWLFTNHPMRPGDLPDGYMWNLGLLYLVFAIAVGILYFPCRWFAGLKARSRAAWLSYL